MTLVEIILAKIPQARLERVVTDQGVVSDKERMGLFKASGLLPEQIAQRTVEAYGEEAPRLASGLYDQIWDAGDFETAQMLVELLQGAKDVRFQNRQASLVARVPNVPVAELNAFLESVERHVCLIVCRKGAGQAVRGTGFLVAPDLVLTCQHVVQSFDPKENILADGNYIELYFDFAKGKDPVEDVGPALPGARKVGLRAEWHLESCPATAPDGLVGALSPADTERITKSLDFVLLHLDQEVGLQPVASSGGRRRAWVKLPAAEAPGKLDKDDWIIIPQHPHGFPLRIDFGRFREPDQTKTRIRYSTNTAPGTSGAPCFNHKFELVGLHNAYVGPPDKPLANQAVRFDFIADRIRAHLDKLPALSENVRRWSVSRVGDEPRVILGRDTLLEWLERSRSKEPAALRERVYAATASAPGAGCSFSSDVLHADIRDQKMPRAVYGSSGQQLPATAEDFLISLLRELEIDTEHLPPERAMPRRPGGPSGAGLAETLPGEIDKLERWLSDELPRWLGDVITRHVEREFDARVAARQTIELLQQQGLQVTDDLVTRANAEAPIKQRHIVWDCAYVVIDDLRGPGYSGPGLRTEFSREVIHLVAALIKGKFSTHSGLTRLRWMFLGYLPDFISAAQPKQNVDGAMVEKLDPASIGKDDVVGIFDRISEARIPLDGAFFARATAGLLVDTEDKNVAPETRLRRLQNVVSDFVVRLFNEKKK